MKNFIKIVCSVLLFFTTNSIFAQIKSLNTLIVKDGIYLTGDSSYLTFDSSFQINSVLSKGISYGGDYSTKILADLRAIPDVGSVRQIVSDSIGGTTFNEGVQNTSGVVQILGTDITANRTSNLTGSGKFKLGNDTEGFLTIQRNTFPVSITIANRSKGTSGEQADYTLNSSIYAGHYLGAFDASSLGTSFRIAAGSTGGIFTDTRATKTGLQYGGDYSAAYTDRSLMDFGSVKQLISDSLPSIDSSLYATDGNIPSLRKIDITATNGQGIKFFNTADEANYYMWLDPQYGNRFSKPVFFNTNVSFNGGTAQFSTPSTFSSQATFNTVVNFNSTAFFTATGASTWTFADSRATTVGIQYSADYSADFTSRSIVDKAYVDSATGQYLKLTSPTKQVVTSKVDIGVVDTTGTAITDAVLGSIGTHVERRLKISSASGNFVSFGKGDYCILSNNVGIPDSTYVIQGTTMQNAGDSTEVWVDYIGTGITGATSCQCYQNNFITYDSFLVSDGVGTIDDSFTGVGGTGRYIIIAGLNTSVYSKYVSYPDSVLIENSNQAEVPNGYYEIWSMNASGTIILVLETPVITNQSFTGDVRFVIANDSLLENNFISLDSFRVKSQVDLDGPVVMTKLNTDVTPTTVVTLDTATNRLGIADYPVIDTTILITQSHLNDSTAAIRADFPAGGSSNPYDPIANRGQYNILWEPCEAPGYDATLTNGQRMGVTGFMNFTFNGTTTKTIVNVDSAYAALKIAGVSTGLYSGGIKLGNVQTFKIDSSSWELEFRYKWVTAPNETTQSFRLGWATADNSYTNGLFFGHFGSTGEMKFVNTGAVATSITATQTGFNIWTTIKITYDKPTSTFEFFVNGVSQGTDTNTPYQTPSVLWVNWRGTAATTGTSATDGVLIDYILFKYKNY